MKWIEDDVPPIVGDVVLGVGFFNKSSKLLEICLYERVLVMVCVFAYQMPS